MPLDYTPISREKADEAARPQVLPPGVYHAEIREAMETTSKNGNAMIKVLLRVFSDDGAAICVDDYIVLTEQWEWKLRHLADSCGLAAEYEAKHLDIEHFAGRDCRVRTRIQKGKPAPDGDIYPDRPVIAEYLSRLPVQTELKGAPVRRTTSQLMTEDDDIPF